MAGGLLSFISPGASGEGQVLDATVFARKRRAVEEAMLAAGATTPIQSPWQGVARLAQGAIAGYEGGQLDKQEAVYRAQAEADFKAALGADASPGVASVAGAMTGAQTASPKLPSFAGGGQAMTMPTGDAASNQTRFVDAVKAGGLTNPNALAAVAAYGQHESGWSPRNISGAWSDPSQSGQPGTSGGALSWRGDRFANMRKATAGSADPTVAQAQFFLTENPALTKALQGAKSVEEANSLMANAWRFAGYDQPGGEFAARLGTARQYLARVEGGQPAAGASQGVTKVAGALSDVPAEGAQEAQIYVPGTDPQRKVTAAMTAATGQAPRAFSGPVQSVTSAMTEGDPRRTAALMRLANNPLAPPAYRAAAQASLTRLVTGKDDDTVVVNGRLLNKRTGALVADYSDKPKGQFVQSDGRTFFGDPGSGNLRDVTPERPASIPKDAASRKVLAGELGFEPGSEKYESFVATGKLPREDQPRLSADIEARKNAAAELGFQPGTEKYETYVSTGKLPKEGQAALTAADRKAIQEADTAVLSASGAIDMLKQAKGLSAKAYEGPLAGQRGYVTSLFGSEGGTATTDYDNLITTQALGQLKSIFGAAPTEGERKILLDIQGSSSQPHKVRERILGGVDV